MPITGALAVYAVHSIECIGGSLPGRRAGWLKLGPNFIVRPVKDWDLMQLRTTTRGTPDEYCSATMRTWRKMTHAIHRVERFEIAGPYTLVLRFDDGTEQRIDFRPVLEGELFGPLQNPSIFNAVSLDKEAGTLTWPNGADFDPTTLHDWPQVRDELVGMAHCWAEQAGGAQRAQ